jgi:hypothetical protein
VRLAVRSRFVASALLAWAAITVATIIRLAALIVIDVRHAHGPMDIDFDLPRWEGIWLCLGPGLLVLWRVTKRLEGRRR